jgi:hypothetical protein
LFCALFFQLLSIVLTPAWPPRLIKAFALWWREFSPQIDCIFFDSLSGLRRQRSQPLPTKKCRSAGVALASPHIFKIPGKLPLAVSLCGRGDAG